MIHHHAKALKYLECGLQHALYGRHLLWSENLWKEGASIDQRALGTSKAQGADNGPERTMPRPYATYQSTLPVSYLIISQAIHVRQTCNR